VSSGEQTASSPLLSQQLKPNQNTSKQTEAKPQPINEYRGKKKKKDVRYPSMYHIEMWYRQLIGE